MKFKHQLKKHLRRNMQSNTEHVILDPKLLFISNSNSKKTNSEFKRAI